MFGIGEAIVFIALRQIPDYANRFLPRFTFIQEAKHKDIDTKCLDLHFESLQNGALHQNYFCAVLCEQACERWRQIQPISFPIHDATKTTISTTATAAAIRANNAYNAADYNYYRTNDHYDYNNHLNDNKNK